MKKEFIGQRKHEEVMAKIAQQMDQLGMTRTISTRSMALLNPKHVPEYNQWIDEMKEPIQVVPARSLSSLGEWLKRRQHLIYPQQCFDNARWIMEHAREDGYKVKYVLGYTELAEDIRIYHAWNYYNGYYFDATYEKYSSIDNNYYKVVSMTYSVYKKVDRKTGLYPGPAQIQMFDYFEYINDIEYGEYVF